MKHLRIFDEYTHRQQPIRDEFVKVKNEDYITIDLTKLKKDCIEYGVNFINLLVEIVLNKKIAFECEWCYSDNFGENYPKTHSIIGECEKIKFKNIGFSAQVYFDLEDSDMIDPINDNIEFLVKIKTDKDSAHLQIYDRWHLLFDDNKKKLRVYNYTEGPLAQELDMLKNSEKYNI